MPTLASYSLGATFVFSWKIIRRKSLSDSRIFHHLPYKSDQSIASYIINSMYRNFYFILPGICLEAVSEQGTLLRRLPRGMLVQSCAHEYCFTCVLTWAERTNTCPMCKERFNAVRRMPSKRLRGVGETIEVCAARGRMVGVVMCLQYL